jgi:hypothetical protein
MNIITLEKVARRALRGEQIGKESDKMLGSGLISAAEHRSLKSLSWQISANVQFDGNAAGTMTWAEPCRAWLSPGGGTVSAIGPCKAWL